MQESMYQVYTLAPKGNYITIFKHVPNIKRGIFYSMFLNVWTCIDRFSLNILVFSDKIETNKNASEYPCVNTKILHRNRTDQVLSQIMIDISNIKSSGILCSSKYCNNNDRPTLFSAFLINLRQGTISNGSITLKKHYLRK